MGKGDLGRCLVYSAAMMTDTRTIDELKEAGAGRLAPAEIVDLYEMAFKEFGLLALWSRSPGKMPTIAQALTIAEALRHQGNMKSRPMAIQIEEACRAAL